MGGYSCVSAFRNVQLEIVKTGVSLKQHIVASLSVCFRTFQDVFEEIGYIC